MIEEKFKLGKLAATPGALDALAEAGIHPLTLIGRHVAGDWGDLDREDWRMNNWSVKNGERILSNYPLPNGVRVWIITEADRSVTTLLLPDEY